MAKLDRKSTVSRLRERGCVGIRAPVGVHDETADPGADEVIEGVGDEWLVRDRHERLRTCFGQRLEPGPQASAEDKRGGNHEKMARRVLQGKSKVESRIALNCALSSTVPDAI